MSELIGPVILDLAGTELTQEDYELLAHPQVGGVILFTRNYSTPTELMAFCNEIRAARKSPLLIMVDQEGGRVQRFREGLTRIPNMGLIGQMYEKSSNNALKFAEICGWIMASEVLALGIDMSLAPVLDLNNINNPAIRDRGFHQNPKYVIPLAEAFIKGMRSAGMPATGKHFPGHGSVNLDSHVTIPVDARTLEEISSEDLQPFQQQILAGIDVIMPAHIIYSAVDKNPVGFSSIWLKKILREQNQFKGIILSDDLNMNGASFAGDYSDRAVMALDAGCDMILICNNRKEAIHVLDQLPKQYYVEEKRVHHLRKKSKISFPELTVSQEWQKKSDTFNRLLGGFQEFVF